MASVTLFSVIRPAHPIRIEDESGEVAWQASVSPYGEMRVAPESSIEFNLRLPVHYYDQETGLHYNRFRYYDPRLGATSRVIQSEPRARWNVYAYPANPLTRVDVRGLSCENHLAGHNPIANDCADNEGTPVKGRPRAPDRRRWRGAGP
jgi:RHS repeat-associated protein